MVFAGSITFRDYPLEEACRRMLACGFTGAEMWQEHLRGCATPELRKAFSAYASEIGLTLFGLNVVGFDYFKPFGTQEELEATISQLKRDIDFAYDLGLSHVFVWEGVRPERVGRNVLRQQCLPRLLEIFNEALDYGAGRDISIFTEPHPFTVGIEDWFACELCDKLDPGRFGLIYDCCHYGVGRPDDYIEAIKTLGPRIKHVHFSDSDQKTSELHFPPGLGKLDLEGIVSALKEVGFSGVLSLDLYGWPMPEAGAKGAIPFVRKVMQQLELTDDQTSS